jgi:hypothetical protein
VYLAKTAPSSRYISTVVAPSVVQRSSIIVGALHSTGDSGPLKAEMRTESGVPVVVGVVHAVVGGTVGRVVDALFETVDVEDRVVEERGVADGVSAESAPSHAAALALSTASTTATVHTRDDIR